MGKAGVAEQPGGRAKRCPVPFSFFLVPFVLFLCAPASRAEDSKPASAELRLKLPPGQTLRYAWALETLHESKGQERGKPLELRVARSIRMTVVLTCEAAPADEPGLAALMRFENLSLQESRTFGEALRSVLRVDRQNIQYTENNRVLIDSRNDVGLEKISAYQRGLRGLERSAARLRLDFTGRQTRVEGDRLLLDVAHGGNAAGLFPVLPGTTTSPGVSWDGRFEIPALADLKLDKPAGVQTRTTFAKWDQRGGKPVALLDMLAAWDGQTLQGRDATGLTVRITRLEGQGGGVYLFDPDAGRFVEGAMTFRLAYHLDGTRENESTALDVTGRGRFSFRLLPPGEAKAEPAGAPPKR